MALASLVKVKTNVPAAFFLIKKGFTSAFCGTVNATFETKCWIQDFKVTFNSMEEEDSFFIRSTIL